MSEAMDINEELMDVAQGKIVNAQPVDTQMEMTQWVFANEMNPALIQMFHSFYDGVFKNRIGIAHVKEAETGRICTMLVGVNPTEDGTQLFPLARVLDEQDVNTFLSPDGNGGWIGEQAGD